MVGMNLRIGRRDLSADFDFKHIFKRKPFASTLETTFVEILLGYGTLLRSSGGMLVLDIYIDKVILSDWLEHIPDRDWSETMLYSLLNPDNPQNVAAAMKLLWLISRVFLIPEHLRNTKSNPTRASEFRALCLLGQIYDAVLRPFIDPNMSLTEQLVSLGRFGHLVCGLWLRNQRPFRTSSTSTRRPW